MAVLLILADRPRKVCSREFLLDAVWGSERAAYDRVLDNAISELRKVFGDDSKAPEFIETITKQGYRLIAEVEWPDASAPPLLPVGHDQVEKAAERGDIRSTLAADRASILPEPSRKPASSPLEGDSASSAEALAEKSRASGETSRPGSKSSKAIEAGRTDQSSSGVTASRARATSWKEAARSKASADEASEVDPAPTRAPGIASRVSQPAISEASTPGPSTAGGSTSGESTSEAVVPKGGDSGTAGIELSAAGAAPRSLAPADDSVSSSTRPSKLGQGSEGVAGSASRKPFKSSKLEMPRSRMSKPRTARPSWQRLGVFGFLLTLLFAAAGWTFMLKQRTLRVHIEVASNQTQDSLYDGLAQVLADALRERRCAQSLIRYRNLPFLAGVNVLGRVERDGEELILTVGIEGLQSSGIHRLQVQGLEKDGQDLLVKRLADEILYTFDQRICPLSTSSRTDTEIGCHCLRAGRRDYAEGSLNDAKIRLDQAHAAIPSSIEVLDLLVGLYFDMGFPVKAAQYLEKLEAAMASDGVESLRFARRSAQLELSVASEHEALRHLAQTEPENPGWPLELAWGHWNHRRACRESLASFEQAKALRGAELSSSLALYGRVALACGRPEQALVGMSRFMSLWPQSPSFQIERGEILRLLGDFDGARQSFTEASRIDKAEAARVLGLARLDLSVGLLERAKEGFNALATRAPWPRGVHDSWIGQALVALKLEDFAAAEDFAAQALNEVEDSLEPLWVQGLVKVGEGDFEKARELAAVIRQRSQKWGTREQMVRYHHLLGKIAMAEGQPQGALAHFADALELNPLDHAELHYEEALAWDASGDIVRAFEAFDQVFAINANHPMALCSAGALRQRLGERDKARALFEKAFEYWNDEPQDRPMRECRDSLRSL